MDATVRVLDVGIDVANLLFWLPIHVLCAALAGVVAARRGLSPWLWASLGLVFGLFAVAGVFLLRPRSR